MKNATTTILATRRTLGAVSATAALGLVLAGCGGQQQPTADETTTTTTAAAAPTTAATAGESPSSPATAQGTDNPLAEDVAGSPEQVYAAIDTAEAAAPGAKAYEYDFDNTQHEVQITDGKQEQQVTVSTDGKTVENTGTDGIDDIVDDREDIVAAKVGMKQAIEAALAQVPGTPDKVELDRDHEITKDHLGWKINVVAANDDEHEVLVDALSGKVVEADVDH